MLARINTIKKAQDFEAIFKGSKSFKNNLFILKSRKNGLDANRVAFMVSKKVSKKAVVRNKVRRRLSEAARAETKKMKNGIDLLLIALPGIEKKEFSEIKKILGESLVKMGLIDSPSKTS